jgi:hypothetical protein
LNNGLIQIYLISKGETVKIILFLINGLAIFTILSCSSKRDLPDNNDFSYIADSSASKNEANKKKLANENSSQSVDNSKTYVCDDFNTELSGQLEEFIIFGPPGFGASPEKDKQITGYKLILTRPILVKCMPGQPAEQVQTIQLNIQDTPESIKIAGSTVVARGQLYSAQTQYHQFPYLMMVKRLEPINLGTAL